MDIGQWVHFSIDDVIGSIKWVYQNCPKSIFEESMFCKLKEWHEKYWINCDLYVYEIADDFNLTDLQEVYCQELAKESDWLKFGWHRRKAGELTDDIKTEIGSFERIHAFIKDRISLKACTNILRLHRWEASEELLTCLSDNGIKYLLTADSNRLSYNLAEDDLAILQDKGGIWKAPFKFLTTDVRFDYFADNMTVESCIDYTQQLLIERPNKKKLEVFCHEWKFSEIMANIEQYWAGFDKMKSPLYMSASVLIEDCLYFTTCNTDFLFKRCLSSKDTKVLTELPCTTHNNMKFSSLIYFENSIWMIPWMEEEFIVYDMLNKNIKVLPIPYKCEEKFGMTRFRKAVKAGKYLWLLPVKTPLLLRINMEKGSIHLLKEWPEGVCFSSEQKMNFTTMCATDKYLYLFRYGCSHNIRVNLIDGSMKIWDVDISKEFGIVADNKLLISPVHSGSTIRCYDINSLEGEKFYNLPQRVWAQERTYAFWYSERVENYIYFLPHEANAIIRMNLLDDSVGYINVRTEDYKTLRPNSEFAAYEAFGLKDHTWVVSFMGNKVIVVDDNGEIIKELTFFIPISKIVSSRIKTNICYESSKVGVLHLFSTMLCQKEHWILEKENSMEIQDVNAEENHGEIIYQELINGNMGNGLG